VGTWGFSYPGFVQWLAMSELPPHLSTAVPAMTPVGSHHFFYMGGAFYLSFMEWFHGPILPNLRRRAGDRSGPWDIDASRAEWAPQRRRWYLHRPLVDIPHMRQHAPFFYDWITHPDESDWWSFANVEDDFDRFEIPVLLLSGWYDSAYGPEGAVRGFRGMRTRAATEVARRQTRLILGPWAHSSIDPLNTSVYDREFGPAAGIDFDAIRLRWFQRWVAGIDNGVENDPPVQLFVMGENRWRAESEFPLARARETALYLTADGGGGQLSGAPPTATEAASGYVYDPADPVWEPLFLTGSLDQRPLAERSDVLVFTSEPLEQDTEVTGEIVARLFVSSDRTDTDFAVTVCDVYPDGTAYTLTGSETGYLRMRYREGFDRQVPMVPGQAYEISIGGLWTSNLFRAGHRIQVMITSSRAPHFDPNPNTGGDIATETRLLPASQTILHDRAHPSRILLPIIPRD
jgi:putative CocE/NonD family hydrolase